MTLCRESQAVSTMKSCQIICESFSNFSFFSPPLQILKPLYDATKYEMYPPVQVHSSRNRYSSWHNLSSFRPFGVAAKVMKITAGRQDKEIQKIRQPRHHRVPQWLVCDQKIADVLFILWPAQKNWLASKPTPLKQSSKIVFYLHNAKWPAFLKKKAACFEGISLGKHIWIKRGPLFDKDLALDSIF